MQREWEGIRRPSDTERSPRGQSVKLPKLIISKFNGDISLWQDLWNQYETAIHKNDVLSKTEKFNYLKTSDWCCLKGNRGTDDDRRQLRSRDRSDAEPVRKEGPAHQCTYDKIAESLPSKEITGCQCSETTL